MRRRDTFALMLAMSAAPAATRGQTAGKVYRIGWLSNSSYATTLLWPEFTSGMRERGWIEGQHYAVEHLVSEGDSSRFAGLAADAVQRGVDLIVCAGTPPTTAARNATSTIPILFFYVGDPVGSGFVASLARPGGNTSGLGGLSPAIYAKQLALLKEAVPKASRIAMLFNPSVHHAAARSDIESTARSLKVTLRPVELTGDPLLPHRQSEDRQGHRVGASGIAAAASGQGDRLRGCEGAGRRQGGRGDDASRRALTRRPRATARLQVDMREVRS